MGTPVSSTNKTDCHDVAEVLLKVALNTRTVAPLHQTSTIIFFLNFITKFPSRIIS